jgi:hypothetical protein
MNYAIVGCDYAARHPEVGVCIRSYYEARHDTHLLPCCRKDLSVLQSGDTVTAGCTLCDLMLAERVPHVRRRSIYRLLLEDEGFAWPDYAGREMALQDCWRMRHDARLQDDVRACLTRMNVRWHELSERREGTTFCGTWLNNPPVPDCVELAPRTFSRLEEVREMLSPKEQEARMRSWCERYPTDEVAVYCNGCERGVALGGQRPVQVLEPLLPPPATA